MPAAFGGVLLLRELGGDDADLQCFVKKALGWALIIAAAGIVLKSLQTIRTKAKCQGDYTPPPVVVKPIPTILVGIVGGVVVGMTSVGSGSLIIVALLFLYPGLKASEIVGTDLVQAVPLVGAAAIGHLLFGDFQFDVASSVLIGAIPGVYVGARVSAHASQAVIRRALVIVLTASALKLLGVGNGELLGWLAFALVIGTLLWALVRHTQGLTRRPEPLTPAAAAREWLGALTGRRRPARVTRTMHQRRRTRPPRPDVPSGNLAPGTAAGPDLLGPAPHCRVQKRSRTKSGRSFGPTTGSLDANPRAVVYWSPVSFRVQPPVRSLRRLRSLRHLGVPGTRVVVQPPLRPAREDVVLASIRTGRSVCGRRET